MAPADLARGHCAGKLYYFKSADDPPNYKGLIDMRECKAEDVDVDGLPRNAAKSKYDLDGGGGQVSLLIRISHKAGSPSSTGTQSPHSESVPARQRTACPQGRQVQA